MLKTEYKYIKNDLKKKRIMELFFNLQIIFSFLIVEFFLRQILNLIRLRNKNQTQNPRKSAFLISPNPLQTRSPLLQRHRFCWRIYFLLPPPWKISPKRETATVAIMDLKYPEAAYLFSA